MPDQHPILIGDYDPFFLAANLTKNSFRLSQLLSKELGEKTLANIYAHNLKQNVGVLRAATKRISRSYLEQEGLTDSIETFYNLTVSQAKTMIEKTASSALLAGVLGPSNNPQDPSQQAAEWAEALIFMTDFGVECLILEDFYALDDFKRALETVFRITNLPVCPFLDYRQFQNQSEDWLGWIEQREIEMLGVQGSFHELQQAVFPPETAVAWMLDDLPPSWEESAQAEHFLANEVWALFPTAKISYTSWRSFSQKLQIYNQQALRPQKKS